MKKICLFLIYFWCVFAPAESLWAQAEVRFPYPHIPDMLKEPCQRLNYLLENFWEQFNWADTTKTNQDVEEQGFSDYIYFLGQADSLTLDKSVCSFMKQAYQSPWQQGHVENLINHYFYNPNSPLRNDHVYIVFLRNMLPYYQEDAAKNERTRYRLRMTDKNMPDRQANDFFYQTRDGKIHSLYKTEAEYTLLFFNDPDCHRCQKALQAMEKDPIFTQPRLKVIYIYADADTDSWNNHAHPLPSNWTDAHSPQGDIMTKELYFIPATPSFYLLDKDKKVILKDATLSQLTEMLHKLLGQ